MNLLLNQILNNINAGLIAVDSKLNVVLLNNVAEKLISSNGNGKPESSEFIKNNPNVREALAKTLESKSPVHSTTEELVVAMEKRLPVIYSTAIIKSNRNRVEGALFYFRLKPELLSTDAAWEDDLFKPTLEDVAADIAHELRNPLGGIIGFATLLEQDLAENESAKGMIKKIIQAANGLEAIVSNLTIVSRNRPKLEMRPVILQDLLRTYCQKFQEIIHEKKYAIEIIQYYPEEHTRVLAAPTIFNQLLDIVFQYFLKILSEEGKIFVGLETNKKSKTVSLNLRVQNIYMDDESLEATTYENKKMLPYVRQLALQRIITDHNGLIHFQFDKQRNPIVLLKMPILYD